MSRWRNKLKDDWRGWLWNRIGERVSNKDKRQGTVLYLPGIDDAERPHALTRGFAPHTLLGVERDAGAVRSLRRKGVLCTQADVSDVLTAWPKDWRVSVLDLDFCGGFDTEVSCVMEEILKNPALSECVVAINMRRGQDFARNYHGRLYDGTNRAVIMLDLMRLTVSYAWLTNADMKYEVVGSRKGSSIFCVRGGVHLDPELWLSVVTHIIRPVTFTYNSGKAKYDSLVFSWKRQRVARAILDSMGSIDLMSDYSKILKLVASESTAYQDCRPLDPKTIKTVRRRLAALRAHQTMRRRQ